MGHSAGRAALLLLAATVVAARAPAGAATLTLQATQDTPIRQDAPTTNGGSDALLVVKAQSGALRRALVQFDVSAIPACAAVTAATLRLHVDSNTQGTGNDRVHAVHRLGAAWSELQATWNKRNAATSWTTAGGDFAPATATAVAPGGTGASVDWDVTADVAAFVTGSAVNNGWLVKDAAESGSATSTVGYAARTSFVAASRPILTVVYAANDAACADTNPCTRDTCDLVSGCQHALLSAGTACPDDGNPCTTDACDAGGSCSHAAGNAGVVCRAAAGACDLAEQCTGTSAICPPDVRATGVCRPAAGVCDQPESCDGVGTLCPPDVKRTGVCRPSAGICDLAEQCDGVTDACPPDAFAPAGLACRAAAGPCDVVETCSGSAAACPPDAKSTAVCRPSAGACDPAERCDGIADACPPDLLAAAGAVCRASAGVCDPAETCSGASVACPPDARSTATCRPAAGACDVAEVCDGVAVDCPPDVLGAAGVECRATAGACDVAERCTGTDAACPPDAFQPATLECRAAAGACDVAEHCTGSSAACPVDAVRAGGEVCRPAAGDCDVAETCDGTHVTCGPDVKRTDVCRPAAGDCDVAETCDGIVAACPGDGFAPATLECRPSTAGCDPAEFCTGTSASCPPDAGGSCARQQDVLCHLMHTAALTHRTVTLTDSWNGTSQATLLLEGHVCNPDAVKGAPIEDPGVHYQSYVIAESPLHPFVPNVRVTNPFGPVVLVVKHATLLLVPAGVKVGATPPDPPVGVDAYVCYRLDFPAFPNFYVQHESEFTTPPVTIKIRKPRFLCQAASLDGAPVAAPDAFMICYRQVPRLPRPPITHVPDVRIRTVFGDTVGEAGKDDLVCMRSTLAPLP